MNVACGPAVPRLFLAVLLLVELYGRRRVAKWGFAMLIHGTQTGNVGIGFRADAEMTVIESDARIVGSALTLP